MPNGVQLGPSEQEIVGPPIFRRHQPGVVAKRLKFATEMTHPGAGLHADQARRHIGEPGFDLAARQLLPQHDRAALIQTHDVKRVLADIDSGDGDCSVEFLRHNALLVFGATCQRNLLAGLEQGQTIPLPVSSGLKMRCCTTQHSLW
jgi:hypothetical protein